MSVYMGLFAVLGRSHVECLLENAAEITGILEAALHGNISDGHIVRR